MKFLLFFGTIAISFAPSAFADNLSKVKLIKEETLSVNEEYFDVATSTSEIVSINATFNQYITTYNVTKDFPCNSILNATVLRSGPECENFKKFNDYSITVCNNKSKYFDTLPPRVLELNKEGKCVPKDFYRTNSHNYFQFYNLLTDEELSNSCFRVINNYETQTEVLYTVAFTYTSNI